MLKYTTVEDLKTLVDEYFEVCDKTGRPYSMGGIAYFLGMTRSTLVGYAKKDEFYDVLDDARNRVAAFVEEQLFINPRTAGIIFNLKNNFGWNDKQEISVSTNNNNALSQLSTAEIKALLTESEEGEEDESIG